VFKALTVAMTIDDGLVTPRDVSIARPACGRVPLRERLGAGSQPRSGDSEHSPNLGAARLALKAGPVRQKAFLQKLGLLTPLEAQTGATASPLFPNPWREVNTVTVSYGHGISVTPLSFAAAACSLVNGGYKVEPQFIAAEPGTLPPRGERVLRGETSDAMRPCCRRPSKPAPGVWRRFPVAIGGKTGTAKKPKDGEYGDEVISSFFAAFPIDAPKYLLFVMFDEPKPVEAAAKTEAAHNAVPSAGAILKRIIPILGVTPDSSSAVMAVTAR
jgi:cell division protein FtsI (penicillin-binding protein 3)